MPILQDYVIGTLLVAVGLAVYIFATAVVRVRSSESLLSKPALVEKSELAWWVKIITTKPRCTYYFGPFANTQEAELAQAGYIEDLEQEQAQGIAAQIEWSQPRELTCLADEAA